MSISAPTPEPLDPHVADDIARAKVRRGVLERFTQIALKMAEEIEERTVGAPYHPEPRHDPGRSFANLSRAVRLTVVLEARIDRDIFAMRKGEVFPSEPTRGRETLRPAHEAQPFAPAVSADSARDQRNRVRGAVWSAINAEVGDPDEARSALDRVHETLIDGGDYDGMLLRPWRDCVEAICADLGLAPDWSGWSDDTGFPPPPPERPLYDWPRPWSYSPEGAETHRRRRAGRVGETRPSPSPFRSDDGGKRNTS